MDNPNRAHWLLKFHMMAAAARRRTLDLRGAPGRPARPIASAPRPPSVPSLRWPVLRSAQATFAEALALGLSEGMGLNAALGLAGVVLPAGELLSAVSRMKTLANAGLPLATSLAGGNFRPHPGLLVALDVGERQGNLAGELLAFARRGHPQPHRRFHRAIGRSEHACAFAAALARRMDEGPLTLAAVLAAGLVAAEGSRRFTRVMAEVVDDFRNGDPLSTSLRNRRRRFLTTHFPFNAPDFDELFCYFIALSDSRESMRGCLIRLAGPDFATPELPRAEGHHRARPALTDSPGPGTYPW